jgi:hypothetical protein
MKRHVIPIIISTLVLAIILLPTSGFGQGLPGLAGAGTAVLPPGTSFSGVALTGVQLGLTAFISSNLSATGELEATLLGTSLLGQTQNIEVEGQATWGTLNADGSRTFLGTATVDMGDGSPALTNVPFAATASAWAILLTIDNIDLPGVPLTGGIIVIQ